MAPWRLRRMEAMRVDDRLGLSAAHLVAGLIAVTAGGGAWLALRVGSTPYDFETRFAALDGSLRRSEAVAAYRPRPGGYGPGAVCAGLEDQNIAQLKTLVTSLAAARKVSLSSLVVSPEEADGAGGLTPVRLNLEAAGSYEAAVGWLDDLAQAKPQIFVDDLDIASQNFNVSVTLSGRVYCWNSARP
jgi:hypothetical protein